MTKRDIAIVGSGISGLSAAWMLARRHRVTLYEKADHIGGHSNTVDVLTDEGRIPVDTGFIVFNPPNYPNLTALFEHLGVATQPAPMSFALSLEDARFEYSGSGINGFFGQRRNLFRADHWQLLGEVNRFFKTAMERIEAYPDHTTLGAFLAKENYSQAFIDKHIVPMGAAIWSSSMRDMLAFPANTFVSFYANHAMLRFFGRGKWRTVTGGARSYVRRLLDTAPIRMSQGGGATRIHRRPSAVMIEDEAGITHRHDHVVIATHADEALTLLAEPDGFERANLSAFRYQMNRAVLHRDARFMPARRRLWSSWNYLKRGEGADEGLCVTYWMNALQSLPTKTNLFVTLNPPAGMHPKMVETVIDYAHPVFDHGAIRAQARLWGLQGRRNTWFAGSYFGYGFHEDGLQSGLAVAEALGGVERPWNVPNKNGRIAPAREQGGGHRFIAAE